MTLCPHGPGQLVQTFFVKRWELIKIKDLGFLIDLHHGWWCCSYRPCCLSSGPGLGIWNCLGHWILVCAWYGKYYFHVHQTKHDRTSWLTLNRSSPRGSSSGITTNCKLRKCSRRPDVRSSRVLLRVPSFRPGLGLLLCCKVLLSRSDMVSDAPHALLTIRCANHKQVSPGPFGMLQVPRFRFCCSRLWQLS